MGNSGKKSIIQVDFFDRIKKSLPANQSLVHVVSDLLGVCDDAVYRRIRGESLLDIDEIFKLSRHFQISFDSLAGVSNHQIQCEFAPLNFKDHQGFFPFAQDLSAIFDHIRRMPESEIIMSAADVPALNFLMYPELNFFQLFSWNKSVCGFPACYEEFVKGMNTGELKKCFAQISESYQSIASTEIFTDHTTDSSLRALRYHFEMGHFSSQKTPLLICEQLLELMNTLENWAVTGTKGTDNAPYRLYLSEIDIGNTFILLKNSYSTKCIIRLFSYNGLSFSDDRFCSDAEHWLQNLVQRSTLISGSSEKERRKFFNGQRQKIEQLIAHIK